MIQGDDTDKMLTTESKTENEVTVRRIWWQTFIQVREWGNSKKNMMTNIYSFVYLFNKYVLSLSYDRPSLEAGDTAIIWKDLAPPFSSCWLGSSVLTLRACRRQSGKVEMLYILEPLLSWEAYKLNGIGWNIPTNLCISQRSDFQRESVSWCITFLHSKTYHMAVEDNTHLSLTVFLGQESRHSELNLCLESQAIATIVTRDEFSSDACLGKHPWNCRTHFFKASNGERD